MTWYVNALVKPFATTTYQPPNYQQWIPGYSYFRDSYDAQLTLAGRTFIAARLNALRYKGVGGKTITANLLIQGFIYPDYIFDDNPISYFCDYHTNPYQIFINGSPFTLDAGWTVTVLQTNLYKNGSPVVGDNNNIPHIVTTVNSYFDTSPTGDTVNVPGSYQTITPPIQYIDSPIIGWNGGAISIDMFTSNVLAEFSLSQNNVGIFIGLCDQRTAILDQRYERIKYAIYGHLGAYSIYVDNVKVSEDFTYVSSDLFRITISDTRVTFYKNGIEVYSLVKEPDSITYVLDASMYYSGDKITNAYMESLPETYYYSNLPIQYSYSTGLISSNLSLIGFKYKYDILIKKNPDLVLNTKYYANLITVNGSMLGGIYNYTGQIENYPSRIEIKYKYSSKLLSKNNSSLEGRYKYQVLLEAGGVIPTIPAILSIQYRYSCFMSNPYIRPPQVFIIT